MKTYCVARWTNSIGVVLLFCVLQVPIYAQPPSAARDAAVNPQPTYLPVCSTEKVNRDCFLNFDRRYPVTLPTIQMYRKARITVYVFHAFPFETLTLDAGNPTAYESSDQASALVTAAIPMAKGAIAGVHLALSEDQLSEDKIKDFADIIGPRIQPEANPPAVLAKKIEDEIKSLDDMLSGSRRTIQTYIGETSALYQQVREIESAAPRPLNQGNQILRYPGIPEDTPNPWDDYRHWRTYMLGRLEAQGGDTANIWGSLPVTCQKGTDAPPPQGPWLPPARICRSTSATEPSATPLDSPSGFTPLYATLTNDLAQLPVGQPDADTYDKIQRQKSALDSRRARLNEATNLLPSLVTKYSTDMQTVYASIAEAPGAFTDPIYIGGIPGPQAVDLTPAEKAILSVYKALGPTITFTVNEQNQIANPLLSLPATTQKQAIATITVLWASPRFEGSAGTFLSWLPNRAFANYTDISVTNGTPSPVDVKISETKTASPLVIPFVGANYRVSPEFTWPGGRRGAVYLTAAIGLNPYDTQVEYAAGLSFAWRFLMFSPLFHLGHDVHLTQGEQVGQLWCSYAGGATATSSPPLCAGAPSAPTTKNFWKGAFAFGISVRVPTTFSSTNH